MSAIKCEMSGKNYWIYRQLIPTFIFPEDGLLSFGDPRTFNPVPNVNLSTILVDNQVPVPYVLEVN